MTDHYSNRPGTPTVPNQPNEQFVGSSFLDSSPIYNHNEVPYQYVPATVSPPQLQNQGGGKIVGSYICAAISVLILPIILGPLAIWLAHSAHEAGNPKGATARTVAICCMIAGFILGAAVALA